MALALAKATTLSTYPVSRSTSVVPRANVVPSEWYNDLFGPGQPIPPQAPRDERLNPRDIDYPISANITFTPRIAYGLLPPATLKSAYDAITEVSLPVKTIVREMLGFNAHLIDGDGNEINDPFLTKLIATPDGETPHNEWMTRFLKNALVYDAGCFHIRQSHGKLDGLEYIDGSTMTLIINERGRLPRPDEASQDTAVQQQYIEKARKWLAKGNSLPATTPAFTQIIHGLPFSWWDQDQIWYKPRDRSMDTPYGESFIERSFAWINIVANVTGFELAHYQTGNMPEGWSETPEGWDEDRTVLWEETFNARMSSGPAERMRVRFLPAGFQYHETKKPLFPQALYDQARDNISLSLGLPVSELGKVPGQGLGGKGFGEAMESSLFRNVLIPVKTYYEGAWNDVFRRFGIDDVFYELQLPTLDTDPEKQKEAIKDLFASGLYTLNDALGELGKDPVDGGDIHIVVANGQVVNLEEYFKNPDQPSVNASGVAQTEPAPQSQSDVDTAKQLLTNAANTGKMSTKTISIPATVGTSTKVSKSVAQYTDVASNPSEVCSLCKHYNGQGGCEVVDGTVAPQGWCKYFEAGVAKSVNMAHPHDHNHHFAPKGNVDMRAAKQVGQSAGVVDAGNFAGLRSVIEGLIADLEAKQPVGVPDKLGKADATHSDGAMIAVFIPIEAAQKLRKITESLGLPSDATLETPQNMHVTLAYLPDANAAKQQRSLILDEMVQTSIDFAPLDGKIQGYGIFNGQDGTHVLFALLDEPQLPFLRTDICQRIDQIPGVEYGKDYGFVPHITMAYFPDDWQLPAGFAVPDIPVTIDAISLAFGESDRVDQPLSGSKASMSKLAKHCGVCPEDDDYFGCDISREATIPFPVTNHANGVEIVAARPAGLDPIPFLWKPQGGEDSSLQDWIGGPMYPREEAAYLIDRALGFYLVPVAFVAEADDETGAAVYYTHDMGDPLDPEDYAPEWIEKAGVLDFVIGQMDRGMHHNYGGNPDDPTRMILFDNGLSFPDVEGAWPQSPFVDLWTGKPLSADALTALMLCRGDAATWADVAQLVGKDAATFARLRLQRLIDEKQIAAYAPESAVSS